MMRFRHGGRQRSVRMGLQEFLRVHSGHATGTCRSDGLAIGLVLDVAGSENAVDIRTTTFVGLEVAGFIHVDLPAENFRVGVVTNADKETGNREDRYFVVLDIAKFDGFDVVLGGIENFLDDDWGQEFDLVVGLGTIKHDFGSAKIVAPMEDGDFLCEARQMRCFFHGCVAAANDRDFLIAKKITIAGGTRGNSVADQLLFGIETKKARGRSSSDDERFGFKGFLPASILNGRFLKATDETAPERNSAPKRCA